MVFAVEVMMAIVNAYHLHEIFSADKFTLIKNPNSQAKWKLLPKKEKRLSAEVNQENG